MNFRKGLSFDDVLLAPRYSDIVSRKEGVDVTSELGSIRLSVPIISSPMDTITEAPMASAMHQLGGLGIIHRYNTIDEQAALISSVSSPGTNVGAACGVTGDYLERALSAVNAGANVICVDIAHGHHVLMKNALHQLRSMLGSDVHIMAGNVATLEGFNDLADWGADSVRVGIGGGSICSTRIQTGHGIPTLQSIIDCASSDRDVPIIADGGIKNSGDIVKALAAGADFVILGSLLSGTDETPGDVTHYDGKKYKAYRGMASIEAQVDWRGHAASIEGVSSRVKCKGPVKKVIDTLKAGITSGLSYSGCSNIISLQTRAMFIEQTGSGAVESSTHIMRDV